MKFLICGLLLAISGFVESASGQITRVPMTADFEGLTANVAKTCDRCQVALSSPAAPKSCPVAVVRSVIGTSDADGAEIEAAYLQVSSGSPGRLHARDIEVVEIPRAKLQDKVNSPVYTEKQLAAIMARPSLADDATIVVPAGSSINASLLIRYAKPRQFVVEQRTSPSTFASNLSKVRNRKYSRNLSVFDFTPRTPATHRAMGVDGALKEWIGFSSDLRKSLAQVGGKQAIQKPSIADLRNRLSIDDGGVVVIYAHADGEHIWLDTDTGLHKLGAAEVQEIGRAAGGKLPSIVLLNCKSDAALADAFLQAGSPFVAATDQSLELDSAARFMKRMARAVFADELDVVDAYFEAQRDTNPFRMRALAATPESRNNTRLIVASLLERRGELIVSE